ncbi:hypothetical protein [Chromobacterium violaceum]|uniref:Uncharacterized protein n=1 Tax=Chromobacterium violaceum TaxID=536 RepID=A0A202B554_CHRVL|nr:hypothetical protein [Chromobacterium violaceum]OVE46706.1 hypothetical protein CBW21_17570 [Chromobacterium violaceum]
MKACDCCAQRHKHIYQLGCETCEARMLARTLKPHRLAAYRRAADRGQDLEALKARVMSEWKLDQEGKAA